ISRGPGCERVDAVRINGVGGQLRRQLVGVTAPVLGADGGPIGVGQRDRLGQGHANTTGTARSWVRLMLGRSGPFRALVMGAGPFPTGRAPVLPGPRGARCGRRQALFGAPLLILPFGVVAAGSTADEDARPLAGRGFVTGRAGDRGAPG